MKIIEAMYVSDVQSIVLDSFLLECVLQDESTWTNKEEIRNVGRITAKVRILGILF